MDQYAHPRCEDFVCALTTLFKAGHHNPEWLSGDWAKLPLAVRATAGDLDALDELHGN